jgi:hypothetical protein
MRTEDELAQLEDPAEESGGYSQSPPDIDGEPFSEMDEAEIRERMDKPAPTPETHTEPDAPADPEAVDWQAFAEEFNFHYAGVGVQNRHTNAKLLTAALDLSEHVATSAPEQFLGDAVAADCVPLVRDHEGRYLFAKEVLADE